MVNKIPFDPIEEALNHTSFHALIAATFLETYLQYRDEVPLEIVTVAIPMVLHAPTRQLLAGNKKSTLIGLIGKHPMIKTHTVKAARKWHSDVLRAIGILWSMGAIEVTPEMKIRKRKPLTPLKFQDKDQCLSKARLIAHVCGKIGNAKTVFALLEVAE